MVLQLRLHQFGKIPKNKFQLQRKSQNLYSKFQIKIRACFKRNLNSKLTDNQWFLGFGI